MSLPYPLRHLQPPAAITDSLTTDLSVLYDSNVQRLQGATVFVFTIQFQTKITKEVQHRRLRGRIKGLMEEFTCQLKFPCHFHFIFQIFCLRPLSGAVHLFFRGRTQAKGVTLQLQLTEPFQLHQILPSSSLHLPFFTVHSFTYQSGQTHDEFSTHQQEIIATVPIKLDQLITLCKTLYNCIVRS